MRVAPLAAVFVLASPAVGAVATGCNQQPYQGEVRPVGSTTLIEEDYRPSEPRAAKTPSEPRSPPGLGLSASDLAALSRFREVAMGASSFELFEGLPRENLEKDVFDRERATKPTVFMHGYYLYKRPMTVEPEVVESLRGFSTSPESYWGRSGPKGCGAFHPDYALVWKDGARRFDLLICFGCGEARIHGPKIDVRLDLAPRAPLSKALWGRREQRPIRK